VLYKTDLVATTTCFTSESEVDLLEWVGLGLELFGQSGGTCLPVNLISELGLYKANCVGLIYRYHHLIEKYHIVIKIVYLALNNNQSLTL
jgi:hypothetical protein